MCFTDNSVTEQRNKKIPETINTTFKHYSKHHLLHDTGLRIVQRLAWH